MERKGIPPVYSLLLMDKGGGDRAENLALFADRWYLNRLWGLHGDEDGMKWMRENMEKEKIGNGKAFVRELGQVEARSRARI